MDKNCHKIVTMIQGEDSSLIKNPPHYAILHGFEVIDIIASSMTVEQFRGFCVGNILKYRLRAGNKINLNEDIKKADEYQRLFEQKKHLCRG